MDINATFCELVEMRLLRKCEVDVLRQCHGKIFKNDLQAYNK